MIFRHYKPNFWVHIDGILCFYNAILGSFCCPLQPVRKIDQKRRDFDSCSKWHGNLHRGCLAYLGMSGIV